MIHSVDSVIGIARLLLPPSDSTVSTDQLGNEKLGSWRSCRGLSHSERRFGCMQRGGVLCLEGYQVIRVCPPVSTGPLSRCPRKKITASAANTGVLQYRLYRSS